MFSRNASRRHAIAVVFVIFAFVIGLTIADLTFFGKNIFVYGKWIECGRAPVEIVSLPGSGRHGHREVRAFEFIRFDEPKFFCSAAQAEAAGFRQI